MISGASGASGSSSSSSAAAAGASGVTSAAGSTPAAPLPVLEWKFSQVFGERAIGEEVQEGMWLDRTIVCMPRDELVFCALSFSDVPGFISSALRMFCHCGFLVSVREFGMPLIRQQ